MNSKAAMLHLEETVELLVQHFGVERVRAALSKHSPSAKQKASGRTLRLSSKPDQRNNTSIKGALEELSRRDEEKHRMLSGFFIRLKNKQVLPEAQDIHHFAHLIGLKEVGGRSRKEMVPKLMRLLIERATDILKVDIARAEGISEQQRRQGYSILTDKLMRD